MNQAAAEQAIFLVIFREYIPYLLKQTFIVNPPGPKARVYLSSDRLTLSAPQSGITFPTKGCINSTMQNIQLCGTGWLRSAPGLFLFQPGGEWMVKEAAFCLSGESAKQRNF